MTEAEMANYTNQQLKNLLISDHDVTPFVKDSLDRTLRCFEPNKNKYYEGNKNISVFHSGQYSIYLYYLANTIYKKSGNTELASKIYYLNKILHSVDWFYAIKLPSYWGLSIQLGVFWEELNMMTAYSFTKVVQLVETKKYPSLGRNVIMYSNATILGNCNVGDNVIIATGTTVKIMIFQITVSYLERVLI